MIISHKHKFIFVKTRKTAGTSIEIALSKICGENDILTPISQKDEAFRQENCNISAQNYYVPFRYYGVKDVARLLFKSSRKIYYNHMTCGEIKRLVNHNVWSDYYKFTIERNPYDRAVSLYFWMGGEKNEKSIYNFLKNYKNGDVGFTNNDIYKIDDTIVVDKIYKYEDLDFLVRDLNDRFNLKGTFELPKYKAKSSARKVKDYKDILDKDSIELIEKSSGDLIESLNYAY